MQRKDCEIRSFHVVWLSAVGFMMAVVPVEGATLTLWRHAVVTADEVSVGEVCRIDDASEDERRQIGEAIIAVAPLAGGSLVIDADEVRRVLRDRGINLATITLKGAAACAVSRPQLTEPEADAAAMFPVQADADDAAAPKVHCLRAIVEDFFAAEADDPNARVLVRFGRANEDALDLCEPRFTFRIQRTSSTPLGMIGLKVTVFERGDEIRSFPLLVDVSRVVPVVVAARAINMGAIVGAGDLRIVELSHCRGERPGYSESQAVIGQRARHFIAEGEPVRSRDLEAVPLVRRGQLVDVQSSAGGVSIMTAAQATSDGAYGDVVLLRADTASRKQIAAVVTGPGRVRISGGDEILAMGGDQ